MLSAEELLAGGEVIHTVEIPASLLDVGDQSANGGGRTVRLRPLTIRDLSLIARAAKDSDALIGALMVQRALVEPELTVAQVGSLPVGLVQFLLGHVNRISGITASPDQIAAAAEEPLAKAAFVLAKAYGWTPQQMSDLTLGQVLLHLQLLKESAAP